MRHFRNARAIEDFLAEQMTAQGYRVHKHGGVRFVRIVVTLESGEDRVGDIDITRIADALERKLA